MNLNLIVPVYATVRINDEEEMTHLHQVVTVDTTLFPFYIQCPDESEVWVLESDGGAYHIWHITYHQKYRGEDMVFSHALITNTSVAENLSKALDQANEYLKARYVKG